SCIPMAPRRSRPFAADERPASAPERSMSRSALRSDGARGSRITQARAEAQARANPIRHLHPITVCVLAVGLLVTAGLVVGSIAVHDRNEDRLLAQRGHEAATVASSSIASLQGE